jgi:hypothetical protein
VTYYGVEKPQMSGVAPFDGVAVLNAPTAGFSGMAGAPPAAQPSVEALRQQAAAIVQRCYRWLEACAPVLPQTAALVPAMIAAVHQYEAQQYAACINQAAAVAGAASQLRAAVPGLPPL